MKTEILLTLNAILDRNCTSIDEYLDAYTYDELIEMWMNYEGIIGYYDIIKEAFETFFNLTPKTVNEL